jgi:hypothetical protein
MAEALTSPGDGRRFDFDAWAQLAKTDPPAFEARRKALIEQTIECAQPHQRERLRRLQWKVDQIRDRSSHPLGACVKISDMMWNSLAGTGGLRDALLRLGSAPDTPQPTARILRFDKR